MEGKEAIADGQRRDCYAKIVLNDRWSRLHVAEITAGSRPKEGTKQCGRWFRT
jgi:hypothetical protein